MCLFRAQIVLMRVERRCSKLQHLQQISIEIPVFIICVKYEKRTQLVCVTQDRLIKRISHLVTLKSLLFFKALGFQQSKQY